jgi:hypothetical protein
MNALTNILGWITKNIGLIIGVVEALTKVLAGIASLTPTEKDDKIVAWIEEHKLSAKLQKVADFLEQSGK